MRAAVLLLVLVAGCGKPAPQRSGDFRGKGLTLSQWHTFQRTCDRGVDASVDGEWIRLTRAMKAIEDDANVPKIRDRYRVLFRVEKFSDDSVDALTDWLAAKKNISPKDAGEMRTGDLLYELETAQSP